MSLKIDCQVGLLLVLKVTFGGFPSSQNLQSEFEDVSLYGCVCVWWEYVGKCQARKLNRSLLLFVGGSAICQPTDPDPALTRFANQE